MTEIFPFSSPAPNRSAPPSPRGRSALKRERWVDRYDSAASLQLHLKQPRSKLNYHTSAAPPPALAAAAGQNGWPRKKKKNKKKELYLQRNTSGCERSFQLRNVANPDGSSASVPRRAEGELRPRTASVMTSGSGSDPGEGPGSGGSSLPC